MRRYISYIIFFLLGLAFTAFVYAQSSPSQKWVNAIESYFNGTNYVNVSSTNPLPVSIPSSSPSATNLTQVNSAAFSKTNPLLVQQTSSENAPANPNEFYYQTNITSIVGINACIVPTTGHTLYITQIIIQDSETAGGSSLFEAGTASGVSGGGSTPQAMTPVNTTLSTLTPPVVNLYSSAPAETSFPTILNLLNSAPSTITSEVIRNLSLSGTAELPLLSAVSSQGQQICVSDSSNGQSLQFTFEGYEQ